jgi:hypothetical protein
LGRPSPLLKALDQVYERGTEAQAELIRSLPAQTQLHASAADLPAIEAFVYFRDRMLRQWSSAPTETSRRKVLESLETLLRAAHPRPGEEAAQFAEALAAARTTLDAPPYSP